MAKLISENDEDELPPQEKLLNTIMKILRSMDATWIKIETSWANNWLLNLWVILPVVTLGLLMMMALLWLMYKVGKLEGPSRMPDNSTRGRSVHANSRVIKSSARFVRPRELEGVRMMDDQGQAIPMVFLPPPYVP